MTPHISNLYYHHEITDEAHRKDCNVCDNALFCMKMVIELTEKKV